MELKEKLYNKLESNKDIKTVKKKIDLSNKGWINSKGINIFKILDPAHPLKPFNVPY